MVSVKFDTGVARDAKTDDAKTQQAVGQTIRRPHCVSCSVACGDAKHTRRLGLHAQAEAARRALLINTTSASAYKCVSPAASCAPPHAPPLLPVPLQPPCGAQ
jgi:hypothetical protein